MMNAAAFADIVAQAIETASAPLLARIAALESRQLKDGRDGLNGKDAPAPDYDYIATKAAALVPVAPAVTGPAGKDGEAGRDGRDGKDIDPAIVAELKSELAALRHELLTKSAQPNGVELLALVQDLVKSAVTAIPPRAGADGKDGAPGLPGQDGARGADGKDGAPGLNGFDGKDGADGKDGRSLTAEDVAPLIAAEVTKAFATVPKPADGIGMVDAIVDRAGHLVMTFTDGRTKDIGQVVGANADPAETALMVQQAVDAIERPKDGRDGVDGKDGANGRDGTDGKDGADGFGFDDVELAIGEKCLLRFIRDGRVKEFTLPIPIYRGPFKAGETYFKGNEVTCQGSQWIATADTSQRPGDGETAWRLTTKKGKDGRDGRDGKDADGPWGTKP